LTKLESSLTALANTDVPDKVWISELKDAYSLGNSINFH